MTADLIAIRQQLDEILAIAFASARASELDQREAELAKAWEDLTAARQNSETWRAATQAATDRFLALIDLQLETLNRGGTNATVLRTLRRQVTAETP